MMVTAMEGNENKTDQEYLLELRQKYEEVKKLKMFANQRADDWEEKCELLKQSMVYMTMFLSYDTRN